MHNKIQCKAYSNVTQVGPTCVTCVWKCVQIRRISGHYYWKFKRP